MCPLSTFEYDQPVKPYHHGNLRQTLVETAADLARTSGPDGVVLREVARRAGVSHNAAYRHFADREELLAEVASFGMTELADAMRAKMARVRAKDPEQRARRRLRATGSAYVDFALAEPGLFEVAFSVSVSPDRHSPDPADPYTLLGQVLDELVEAGVLAARARPGAETLCWSAVHGFALLHLSGPLREVPARQRGAALEQLLDAVDAGLGARGR
jgi:AcrR family transcriptional regulator